MKRMNKISFTGAPADLSWQIGFEEPTETKMGILGIAVLGATARDLGLTVGEKKARAEVLKTARGKFPMPTSCADAEVKIPAVRAQLLFDQTKGSKVNGPRWVEAMTTILGEHMQYMATNCSDATPITQPVTDPAPVVDINTPNATTTVPANTAGPLAEETKINLPVVIGLGVLALIAIIVVVRK